MIGKVVVLDVLVGFSHMLDVSPGGQRVLSAVEVDSGALFTRVGSSVPIKNDRRSRGTASGRRGGDRISMCAP